MTETTVPPVDAPDHFAEIAAALYRLADDIVALTGSGLPKPSVSLSIQPGARDGDDDLTVKAVDAVTSALFGHPGQVQALNGGIYHYNNGNAPERVGPVEVRILYSLSPEFALKRQHATVLAAREAELERLRAEVAELRAAATQGTGLAYSREADDPTPVSPARVPLHTGGVVDGGQLVDETPAEPEYPLVHMGTAVGGTACGRPVAAAERVSLVWLYVTCRACIDGPEATPPLHTVARAADTVPVPAEDATLTPLRESASAE